MDDGGFTPNSPIFGDIDIDFIDQLLDEGCWLQTADGSKFLQSPPSTSGALENSSTNLDWPPQQPDASHQELKSWGLTCCIDIEAEKDPGGAQNTIWIAPKDDAGGSSSSVRDRLMTAIRHFQSLTMESGLLIQIWVPVRRGIKNFLTTVEQPHLYDPNCAPLLNYRNVSEGYQFSADEDSTADLGLPGRVFLGKVPEWSPDVRLFGQDEYPRVNYALMCDVRGSVALPVFESGSGDCLGVVEIVTTTQKTNYRPEVESVCKALQAVNLRSSEIISPLMGKGKTDVYDIELAEILRVIRAVCDKHSLPLGQTWAPCTQRSKGGCWRLDKNTSCISTIDSACYVRDQSVSGFHEACCEQHLFQDQGTVGKTFMTNQPCYAADVTEYSKAEYPLSHYAKMFGLRGAIAMHLQCLYGGLKSCVLEFFLPIDCHDSGLTFHFEVMESLRMEVQGCQSLSFIDGKLGGGDDEKAESPSSGMPAQQNKSSIPKLSESGKGKSVAFPFKFGKDELKEEFKVPTHGSNNKAESCRGKMLLGRGNNNREFGSTGALEELDGSLGDDFCSGSRKKGEKRRTNAQKSISLQVLRQHFSGSLKDAAKSIGVCPTTLKRICRHHGIKRWPSRKIKKVDHSLRKLQRVIDSVQGAQGSIQLSSFYSNFPELSSQKSRKIKDQSEQLTTTVPESSNLSGGTTCNSTSSSQTTTTSSSSHSLTAGAANAPDPCKKDPGGYIKRARSEALLTVLDQKTSHSNNSLIRKNPLPREGLAYKVKATFGGDKVRLTLAPNMGFGDLQGDIAARFGITDVSRMQIKYLDDDNEWVLLTCDDDLEECVDIHRSFTGHTIKLLVNQASPGLVSSFGSNAKS